MATDSGITFRNISEADDFLILASDIPYEDVLSINGFIEDYVSMEGNVLKEFRWSYDGVTYSQWLTLSNENLQIIDSTKFTKFWMEFRYTLLSNGDVDIASVSLDVIYKKEPSVDVPLPIAYSREKGNTHWPIRLRAFSLRPLKQNNAIKLQKDLSFLVNQIHGHEITYFRAVPDPKSRDIIYLEWTLQNVSPEPKCLKVLVPDNAFPEHKLNHNAFGLNFEMPFEVHIDKRYFEWIFGQNTRPQKRDIIYFPLTNRMYEVESANISVQFMYDFLYWQLNLVKWQPKRNVIIPENIQEMFDDYTTGLDDMFGLDLENEKMDISNPQQLTDKTTKFDKIRKYVSPHNIEIYEPVVNNYTTITNYYYDFNKHFLYNDSNYIKAVGYKVDGEFGVDENLAYTCWFREVSAVSASKDILSVSVNGTTIEIKYKYGLPKVSIGNVLGISDSSQGDFGLFGTVTDINPARSQMTVTIEVDSGMLNAANVLYPNWSTSLTLKGAPAYRRNFLYTFKDEKGIVIDIYDSRYIRIQLNASIIWFPLPVRLQANTWYGLVINISNLFNQISYHIYKMADVSQKTTVLDLVVKQVISNLPNVDRTSGDEYQILASPINITNIRVLNEVLEEEKHSLFLNSELLKDASHAIIIDNATPQLKLPYIANPK